MKEKVKPHTTKEGWHTCWEKNVYKKGFQLNRYPHNAVVSFIHSNYKNIKDKSKIRILELGFGAGNNLWFAAREGFSVFGIEASQTAVNYAKNRFSKNSLKGNLRCGDFRSLPWEVETFDTVIDRGSLTCNTQKTIKDTLDEAKRVMKKKGKIFSFFYSDRHPGRILGRNLENNTFDKFSDGYFKGLGRVHFTNSKEIEEIFGSRFEILNLVHTVEENFGSSEYKIQNAFWKIECIKM
jgi:cyclopropane fatty-acyl-phospholipid synthase-like methyltransferase